MLGASDSPMRYSFLAVRRLKSYDHPVVAIGKKQGVIDDTQIITEHRQEEDVDTVNLIPKPNPSKTVLRLYSFFTAQAYHF